LLRSKATPYRPRRPKRNPSPNSHDKMRRGSARLFAGCGHDGCPSPGHIADRASQSMSRACASRIPLCFNAAQVSETRQPVSRHGPIWTSQSRNKQPLRDAHSSTRALSSLRIASRSSTKLFELRDWSLGINYYSPSTICFADGLIVGLERSRLNGASKFLDLAFIDLARFAGQSLRLRRHLTVSPDAFAAGAGFPPVVPCAAAPSWRTAWTEPSAR